MQQKAGNFNALVCKAATQNAQNRIDHFLDDARCIQEDLEKEQRLQKWLCAGCHYFPRMGGAAMTQRPCACCGVDQLYGSTATDLLCTECASKHQLCKRCGSDIGLNGRRRKWPNGPEYQAPEPGEKPATKGFMLLPLKSSDSTPT